MIQIKWNDIQTNPKLFLFLQNQNLWWGFAKFKPKPLQFVHYRHETELKTFYLGFLSSLDFGGLAKNGTWI